MDTKINFLQGIGTSSRFQWMVGVGMPFAVQRNSSLESSNTSRTRGTTINEGGTEMNKQNNSIYITCINIVPNKWLCWFWISGRDFDLGETLILTCYSDIKNVSIL